MRIRTGVQTCALPIFDLRFLQGFARCALCAALAKLHEAGRERPQTEARLDVATTHQHPAISVFRNHADDQFRIQILDMSAAAADVAWQMIAVRNAEGGRLPTEMAEADRSEEHTSELQSLMRTSYAV